VQIQNWLFSAVHLPDKDMLADAELRAMYTPPAFRDDDRESRIATIRAARIANVITATAEGLYATPLPLLLDEREGEHGVLYGHLARANEHWRLKPVGYAMAIFMGPDAYVTPS
jgi:transcriptional regulator